MTPDSDEMFAVSASRIVYRPERAPVCVYAVTPATGPPTGGFLLESPGRRRVLVRRSEILQLADGRVWPRCGPAMLPRRHEHPGLGSDNGGGLELEQGLLRPIGTRAMAEAQGIPASHGQLLGHAEFANPYNEFPQGCGVGGRHQHAAYGYLGRDTVEAGDANYLNSGLTEKQDTMPVASLDGSDHDGRFATHSNGNYYGIFDLSGNATEWLNDPGQTNVLADRGCYGGLWFRPAHAIGAAIRQPAFHGPESRGFRVTFTFAQERMYLVRIP